MQRKVAQGGIAAATDSRSSRFRFELATAADDAQLRQLLQTTPMPGSVRVTLRRAPSFFEAAAVEGPDFQVLVARDTHDGGRIVGMGSVSVRDRYVDGRPEPIGYLGGLRVLPEFRHGTLLARGFRALRKQLDQSASARCYLTTITEGNVHALAALTKGRADLPGYRLLGVYHSMVVPLRRVRCDATAEGLQIRPLRTDELATLVEFLTRVGRQRPFFPCYTEDDFEGLARRRSERHDSVEPLGRPASDGAMISAQRGSDATPGGGRRATFLNLPPERILTAWQGSKLIGTLGLWDQLPFRQTVVEGYAAWLAWLRPARNAWARLSRQPQFPRVGQPFRYLTAALPLVRDGNPVIFQQLLAAAAAVADEMRHTNLLLGMGAYDPLFPRLRQQAVFTYRSFVYGVNWHDQLGLAGASIERDFYLELGSL